MLGAKRVSLVRVPKESFIVGCQKSVLRLGAKRVLVLSGAKRVFYCWVPKECLKVGCQKSVCNDGCQKSVLLRGAKRVSSTGCQKN